MTTAEERLARLRAYNNQLQGSGLEGNNEVYIPEPTGSIEEQTELESIAMRRFRPVLSIKDNQTELVFKDPDDIALWKQPLEAAKALLEPAIRAVGRIDLKGHGFEWVGTGWLVAPEVIVTNRHVAEEFARGDTLVFTAGLDGPVSAGIDFLREFGNDKARSFKIIRPLHIEPKPGPDLAFFAVEQVAGAERLASKITLSPRAPTVTPSVAVIGYPGRDGRLPDQDLMVKIYGTEYDKKRLAPGAVTRVDAMHILHDCSTLGGNSGSVVLDLTTGEAVGLHFSGSFMKTNYAVRADIVKRRLDELLAGNMRRRRATPPRRPPSPERPAAVSRTVSRNSEGTATITIPLVVTVSIGAPVTQAPSRRPIQPRTPPAQRGDEADIATESAPEDYADRKGYLSSFLGDGFQVELPTVTRDKADVLAFNVGGKRETVLRYEHFSVVMSASRRMCLFSAVNIDGEQSKKSTRAGWRTDPRIGKDQQILNECYGSPPKFSRGHMTRREDPAWGTPATVKRGNEDSMHVTNTVPQMQAFNSPIWLELENYALQNARQGKMNISVFTGPYFDYDDVADPVVAGVQIPRSFWKIIAFVHDETGELCATGYEMSQEANLPAEEFVFGDFVSSQLNVSTQVPISSIEARSGLSFGDLASFDPLATQDEGVDGGPAAPLQSFEQIRFH